MVGMMLHQDGPRLPAASGAARPGDHAR
jgi:hypothetical protein